MSYLLWLELQNAAPLRGGPPHCLRGIAFQEVFHIVFNSDGVAWKIRTLCHPRAGCFLLLYYLRSCPVYYRGAIQFNGKLALVFFSLKYVDIKIRAKQAKNSKKPRIPRWRGFAQKPGLLKSRRRTRRSDANCATSRIWRIISRNINGLWKCCKNPWIDANCTIFGNIPASVATPRIEKETGDIR